MEKLGEDQSAFDVIGITSRIAPLIQPSFAPLNAITTEIVSPPPKRRLEGAEEERTTCPSRHFPKYYPASPVQPARHLPVPGRSLDRAR